MGKRVSPTRAILPQLKQALLKEAEDKARLVAENIKDIQRELYARTTKYWNDSGINKFAKPEPEFVVQVLRQPNGIVIRIKSTMKAGGSRSSLWYWLDQGTSKRTQKRTSPPIPERAALRTTPGDLDAKPFPGFTGKFFVIRAGRQVRGIPARGWSKEIVRQTQDRWKERHGYKVTEIKYG